MAEEGPNHISWDPASVLSLTALSPGLPQDSSDSVTAIIVTVGTQFHSPFTTVDQVPPSCIVYSKAVVSSILAVFILTPEHITKSVILTICS